MAFLDELRELLEAEETLSAGKVFGGTTKATKTSYSVATVRDRILQEAPFEGASPFENALARARGLVSARQLSLIVASLLRFSFLIELTNLDVTSTKMKTRWLPGKIKMPQPGSFTPIEGTFEPGNDPRAASFEECVGIFAAACALVCDRIQAKPDLAAFLESLSDVRHVAYEFPVSYQNPNAEPLHTVGNVAWSLTNDLEWLTRGRKLLKDAPTALRPALRELEKKKLEVKVFKTDRALTGKDKTNRAKRWEVLAGDFQHATLEECWSAERKLIADVVCFSDFPEELRESFCSAGLIPPDAPPTRCPVTLELLSYEQLSTALLDPKHGVSDYQVGHLHPLKRGGKHDGANVCWQSANGNRIQGDLSIEETEALLDGITARRAEL